VTGHIADAQDQQILHMQTTDPLRTPTFTDFANPTYFYQTGTCSPSNPNSGCPFVNGAFAWNHGGDQPEVDTTWLGMVGPTVNHLGETGNLWTDHTQIRPTMLQLLGLPSSYEQDGGAITQMIHRSKLPQSVRNHVGDYQSLEGAYLQLNAPVGEFGHDSEIVSTTAAESSSPGDSTYKGFDQQLAACEAARAPLAAKMKADLNDAVFAGAHVVPGQWRHLVNQANMLIADMHSLSGMTTPPTRPVCS
jgi:hypothetical protein